jgi:hypothetical protein
MVNIPFLACEPPTAVSHTVLNMTVRDLYRLYVADRITMRVDEVSAILNIVTNQNITSVGKNNMKK